MSGFIFGSACACGLFAGWWFASRVLGRLPSHGPDLKPREHNGYSDHYPPPHTWGDRVRERKIDRLFDADFDCVSEEREQVRGRMLRAEGRNED